MDTKFFEEYQAQLLDWQKKFFNTWVENLPKGQLDFLNVPDTLETSLKFQEELVKSYLEAQEQASKMMIDSQKDFWDKYFETIRKQPVTAN